MSTTHHHCHAFVCAHTAESMPHWHDAVNGGGGGGRALRQCRPGGAWWRQRRASSVPCSVPARWGMVEAEASKQCAMQVRMRRAALLG
eukprot:1159817-Pelagomonas_calceolata.AAC.4